MAKEKEEKPKVKESLSEKDLFKLVDEIDNISPYSCYLSESTFSKIDEYIDTGSMALNAIISGSLYKGIPCGRITQFAGPSMTGKTFFVLKSIANAQKMGKIVVLYDSENAIDALGAEGFGIDASKVKYIATTTVENTRNSIKRFLNKVADAGPAARGKFVIVVDSIAQMETELGEKRMSEDNNAADMGTFAKSIKAFMKTCVNWGKVTKTTFIFTNEVYDDPSAMYPPIEKSMPGGKGAVYKPSVTVQLARVPTKDDEGKTIDNTLAVMQKKFSGIVLRGLTVKNRLIKQFLECEMYLSFATGLDKYYGLLAMMRGFDIVVLEGKQYKDYEGNSLGFYKRWRKDKAVWDRLLPKLEEKIHEAWKYSNEEGEDYFEDEDPDAGDDEDEEEDESPLAALKKLKKQVTAKLDEEESVLDEA
jgi:RecA/RadA recombinase